MFSGDFDGKDGTSYRDLMDIDSAANYWLVNTFNDNGDGYGTGSTYIYKKRDTIVDGERQTGKLYWGPLWDFDFAWYYDEESDTIDLKTDWVRAMMADTGDGGFVDQVQRMAKHILHARVLCVFPEEFGVIVDADDPAGVSERAEHLVGQIPAVGAEGAGVRVGGYDRILSFGKFDAIKEAFVRKV